MDVLGGDTSPWTTHNELSTISSLSSILGQWWPATPRGKCANCTNFGPFLWSKNIHLLPINRCCFFQHKQSQNLAKLCPNCSSKNHPQGSQLQAQNSPKILVKIVRKPCFSATGFILSSRADFAKNFLSKTAKSRGSWVWESKEKFLGFYKLA